MFGRKDRSLLRGDSGPAPPLPSSASPAPRRGVGAPLSLNDDPAGISSRRHASLSRQEAVESDRVGAGQGPRDYRSASLGASLGSGGAGIGGGAAGGGAAGGAYGSGIGGAPPLAAEGGVAASSGSFSSLRGSPEALNGKSLSRAGRSRTSSSWFSRLFSSSPTRPRSGLGSSAGSDPSESWREDSQGKRRASGAWGRGAYALVAGLCLGLLLSEHLYVRSKAAGAERRGGGRLLLSGSGGALAGGSAWGGSSGAGGGSSALLLAHASASSAASPVELSPAPFTSSVGFQPAAPRPVVYVGTPGEVSPPLFGVDAARAIAAEVDARGQARDRLAAAVDEEERLGGAAARGASAAPNATALLRGPLALALESALRGPIRPAAAKASGAKGDGAASVGDPLRGVSGASLARALDALALSLARGGVAEASAASAGSEPAALSSASSSSAAHRRSTKGLFSALSASSSPLGALSSLSSLSRLCSFARAPSPRLLEPDAIPRSDPSGAPANALDALLREAAPLGEVLVAVSDHRLAETGALGMWLDSVRRAGVSNYVIVALTKELLPWCSERGARCHLREARPSAAQAGGGANHATSSVKYAVLLDFVRLGYAPLLSDVDVLTLRDPFAYLHRDADLEAMSDGWDEASAYGESYGVEDPSMGWSRWSAATRRASFNSGLFFLRANARTLEFLEAVDDRLAKEATWDQTAFNEAASLLPHGDKPAPRVLSRVMDLRVFMNSKVLFKKVRHMAPSAQPVPAMLHVNYHPDKVPRMAAAMRYYWEGDARALDPFPGGSEPGS